MNHIKGCGVEPIIKSFLHLVSYCNFLWAYACGSSAHDIQLEIELPHEIFCWKYDEPICVEHVGEIYHHTKLSSTTISIYIRY